MLTSDIDTVVWPHYLVLLSPQAAVQFPSLPPDHMISLSIPAPGSGSQSYNGATAITVMTAG